MNLTTVTQLKSLENESYYFILFYAIDQFSFDQKIEEKKLFFRSLSKEHAFALFSYVFFFFYFVRTFVLLLLLLLLYSREYKCLCECMYMCMWNFLLGRISYNVFFSLLFFKKKATLFSVVTEYSIVKQTNAHLLFIKWFF